MQKIAHYYKEISTYMSNCDFPIKKNEPFHVILVRIFITCEVNHARKSPFLKEDTCLTTFINLSNHPILICDFYIDLFKLNLNN